MTFRAICVLTVTLALLAGCQSKPAPSGGGDVKVVGNVTCPVSDKPVGGTAAAPSFYSDYRGHRVGFMCPSCKGKFDGADDSKKEELLRKAIDSVGKKKP